MGRPRLFCVAPVARRGPFLSLARPFDDWALAGFRWSWKLAVFVSPLCVLAWLKLNPRPRVWHGPLLVGLGLLSLIVCFQGRHFNLSANFELMHPHGLNEVLAQTEFCLEAAQVPEGARLVHVGDHEMDADGSLIAMTLVGNAPLLLDRGTAHIYQPLERREAAEGHLELTLPWRVHIDSKEFLANRPKIQEAFRFMGVTHLFTTDVALVASPDAHRCRDWNDHLVYFWPLPGRAPHFTRTLPMRLNQTT